MSEWVSSSNFALINTLVHRDTYPVYALAFSPDGKMLAAAAHDEIQLWNSHTGQFIRALSTGALSQQVRALAFKPDGTMLAGAYAIDSTVKLWDLQGNLREELILRGTREMGTVSCALAFGPQGDMLVSCDGLALQVWDTSSKRIFYEKARDRDAHPEIVYSLAFTSDGKMLAIGYKKEIELWYWIKKDGKMTLQATTLKVPPDQSPYSSTPYNPVAFSPDGKWLAKGSYDDSLHLWKWPVKNQEPPQALLGHSSWVTSVAFSPDSKLLASGSGDKTVKLWQVSSGQLLRTLEGQSEIHSVAFSPDGQVLVCGCHDRTIKVWKRK